MDATTVVEAFEKRFGGRPDRVVAAPGRINLIGEHTDYNDGFVFPAAIDRRVWLASRPTDGPTRTFSASEGDGEGFDATQTVPNDASGWAAFASGMAWVLRQKTGKPMRNLEVAVVSDLPIGSGVSSSAAIEMAFGVAWNAYENLGLKPDEIALLAQRCENEAIGVRCGIMDMMASAMGRAGHAMFLDTRTLKIRYATLPTNLAIALLDTQTRRELSGTSTEEDEPLDSEVTGVDSAYNRRRLSCERAAAALGVPKLRDATLGMLDAQRNAMPDYRYRRARHVITENQRCLDFAVALNEGNLKAVGTLMRASHLSLRDDYEVTSPALDAMAEAAWEAPGCVGARMTGAGFGGACVALLETSQAEAFLASVEHGYRSRTGKECRAMLCQASDGAAVVPRF